MTRRLSACRQIFLMIFVQAMLRSIWARCLRVSVFVSMCVRGFFHAPVSAKLIIYICIWQWQSQRQGLLAGAADAGQDFSNYAQHTQISQCFRTSIIVFIIIIIIASHQLHHLTTYALCAQFNQITQWAKKFQTNLTNCDDSRK